nr:MAG TPA: Neurotoxin magi-4, toxin, sodium channel inhibitor [Caudoviricetes sp.]
MSQFKLRTHYPIYNEQGEVESTLFELFTETPNNYVTI